MKLRVITVGFICACGVLFSHAQTPVEITTKDINRAKELVSKMTLDEKLSLISGNDDGMSLRPIKRLGIPALQMHDGPQGIGQGIKGIMFPCGMLTAATWDRSMAKLVGESLATDFKNHNTDVILGPGVNIYRATLCGRNFEYFGEDPFLASETAKQYILGVQSKGVIATIKHFAANNMEWGRMDVNSNVDLRTLNEIYLATFRKAVKEAKVGAVMDSYNLLYGLHTTESRYLNIDLLRKKWGFQGIVMSDWGAVHSTVATANGGLDLEMPNSDFWKPEKVKEALAKGLISEATINEKVQHILQTMSAFGVLDKDESKKAVPHEMPELKAAALKIAESGITLLKNEDDVLPIAKQKFAVIGPNADKIARGGGSGQVNYYSAVTPWAGIKKAFGKQASFISDSKYKTQLKNAFFTDASMSHPGFKAEYFKNKNLEGEPALTRTEENPSIANDTKMPEGFTNANFSVRWSGVFKAQKDAAINFIITGDDGYRLIIDGKTVCNEWRDQAAKKASYKLNAKAGKTYNVAIEYYQGTGDQKFELDLFEYDLNKLGNILKDFNTAVVMVGYDTDTESEGSDRTFDLPDPQNELICNVASKVKNVIVVANSGGGFNFMPWIYNVKGVIMAWYPGQEGGTALANILKGTVNPSGKLPMSIEKKWEDNPVHDNFFSKNGEKEITYQEGLFYGYRGYDAQDKRPLFPFGFGLSYTTFSYSDIKAQPLGKNRLRVTFKVTNTGKRAGAEVAELYVCPLKSKVVRPVKELKGYEKVYLEKGASKTVTIDLNEDAFSYSDVETEDLVPDNGSFRILVGPSSDDLSLQTDVNF